MQANGQKPIINNITLAQANFCQPSLCHTQKTSSIWQTTFNPKSKQWKKKVKNVEEHTEKWRFMETLISFLLQQWIFKPSFYAHTVNSTVKSKCEKKVKWKIPSSLEVALRNFIKVKKKKLDRQRLNILLKN